MLYCYRGKKEYKKNQSVEDYVRQGKTCDRAQDLCLNSIQFHLQRNNKSLQDFGLPEPTTRGNSEEQVPLQNVNLSTLNKEQRDVYVKLNDVIYDKESGRQPKTPCFIWTNQVAMEYLSI